MPFYLEIYIYKRERERNRERKKKEREERVIKTKINYIFEKYFWLTSLSIHCIYIANIRYIYITIKYIYLHMYIYIYIS